MKDRIRNCLVDGLNKYAPDLKHNDEIIDQMADFLSTNNLWDTKYWEIPSYYAKIQTINELKIDDDDETIYTLICEYLDVNQFVYEANNKRRVELIPQMLPPGIELHSTSNFSEEDLLVLKLQGKWAVNAEIKDNGFGNNELIVDDKEKFFGNEKLMPKHQWDAIEESFDDGETDLVINEVSNYVDGTYANIMNDLIEQLKEQEEKEFNKESENGPVILKEGFCTELYKDCNSDNDRDDDRDDDGNEFYTYRVLLSERTGESHGKILAVGGNFLIEKTKSNRYTLWCMGRMDAEPYTDYDSFEQAKQVMIERM